MLSLCACSHVSQKTNSNYIDTSEPNSTEIAESSNQSSEDEESSSPTIYEVSDLVSYFNAKGEEERISVSYVEEKDYWYLHYIGKENTDTSKENLSSAISYFLDYIPLYGETEDGYMFKYKSEYMDEADPYFVYVAVSSNHFVAISIYSYIEEGNLINDILIYNGRNGLYV